MAKQADTGVYQLRNGNWAFRYTLTENGNKKDVRRSKNENGQKLRSMREAIVARDGNVKKCAVGKHPKSEKLGSTGQAACCARIHSRYFTGGSPSGLRV